MADTISPSASATTKATTWTAGKTIWPHPGSYSDMVVLDDMTIGLRL